jgi:hypothetical protein
MEREETRRSGAKRRKKGSRESRVGGDAVDSPAIRGRAGSRNHRGPALVRTKLEAIFGDFE